jgi:type II secretory ATPase GspE/PulE/Tfp pilus assembly ATPase PilB-like protein
MEAALRAILRQDPDVIMVGEIRERSTAELSVHAAMTGHLVLSTVHARDSIGALSRLLEMDIPPVVIAQVVNGVISQRLVHRLCPECAVAAVHPPLEHVSTYEPVGCDKCSRGFFDRVGIQEVFTLSDPVRKLMTMEYDEDELRMLVLTEGMETLKEDAIYKSIEGSVSYREALGITDEPLHRILADIRRVVATLG